MNSERSRNLFSIHVLHLSLRYALVHTRTRLDTTIAHKLVEHLGVHLVHTPLLLEALDGELDTLDKRSTLAVHTLFLFCFFWLQRWLDVSVLKPSGFLHVLGRALWVHFLLLWM